VVNEDLEKALDESYTLVSNFLGIETWNIHAQF
jgi:hypothetical protein